MCKIANLREDPFVTYSAENEVGILDDIFYVPPFYSSLKSMMKTGCSRFILGQRGHGKSMLIHQLRNELYRDNCLPVVIDKFDGIPLENNEPYFLYRIAQAITMGIAEKIVEGTVDLSNADKHLKRKFGELVEMFYDKRWAPTFMEKMDAIQTKKKNNWFKSIYNRLLQKPIDEISSFGIALTGELLRQTVIGKDYVEYNPEYRKNLFPGFSISEFRVLTQEDANSISVQEYKNILSILIDIVKSTRLASVVVLFDKVDEYAPLKSNSRKVAQFSHSILTDTDLLYQIGIVFSLWSGSRNELNNIGVRFDKFQCMDIRWSNEDLEGIVNKRLLYYSKDRQNPATLNKLIPQDDLRNKLFELAESSPRNILILLNEIQAQQENGITESFSSEAIGKGMMKYCKQFDYQAFRSVKSAAGKDFKDWINKLLAIRKPSFTQEEYTALFGGNKRTVLDHLKKLQAMDLIRISPYVSEGGDKMYEVSDPRIVHMMARGVVLIE